MKMFAQINNVYFEGKGETEMCLNENRKPVWFAWFETAKVHVEIMFNLKTETATIVFENETTKVVVTSKANLTTFTEKNYTVVNVEMQTEFFPLHLVEEFTEDIQ